MKKISVILPIYNEEGNLKKLFCQIKEVLEKKFDYEIIAVNDGSIDNSFGVLKNLSKKDSKIKVINFARNFGQTAAITAGINNSNAEVVVLIDSDLENDPADIIKLLKKMDEGFDVVSGWRKNRWKGKMFTRKLPSVIANYFISKISGLKLHDFGCTLKVYKRDMIKDINLYGEMHRFIPVYLSWQGAKIAEMEVHYRKREYGESFYGISRTFRVLLDLVVMRFLDKYLNRPIHFFGGLGFASFFVGVFSFVLALILKIMEIRSFVSTPLPVFSALFIIVGVQLIAMGIIAEMVMRVYYEGNNKKVYRIKEKINFYE